MNEVRYEADSTDEWNQRYTYDADNRIRTVASGNNHLTWDVDAKYFYYPHGPLARLELGNYQVQGLDYIYTLQGWLKGTNSTTLDSLRDTGLDGLNTSVNNQFAPDAFSFSLGYFEGDYQPIDVINKWTSITSRCIADPSGSQLVSFRNDLFNGNISYMMTSIKNPLTGQKLPQSTAYKYDQLNRLREERAFKNINVLLNKWKSGATYSNRYFNTFAYDDNGNILAQKKYDSAGAPIDNATYRYFNSNGKILRNRLYMIDDAVASGNFSYDLDDQGLFNNNPDFVNTKNNYSYTAAGELMKDSSEQIQHIVWNSNGKLKELDRYPGSSRNNLDFEYDISGNRIAKHVYNSTGTWINSTYYVRDVNGNIVATYLKNTDQQTMSYQLRERYIYGTFRLGTYTERMQMIGAFAGNEYLDHFLGKRFYEGVNHLGNVITVFTDRKLPVNSGGNVKGFKSEILSAMDYYPGGAYLEGRSFNKSFYRFGFNDKENDNEVYGEGNFQDYGIRMYDTRRVQFISPDPLAKKFPYYSPYQFAGNKEIWAIDMDGLEEWKTNNDECTYGPYSSGYATANNLKAEDGSPIDKNRTSLQELHKSTGLNVKGLWFDRFKSRLHDYEGGFSDNPKDPGGSTNKGITLNTFGNYAAELNLKPTVEDLKKLTTQQADYIFKKGYWDVIGSPDFSDEQFADFYFDFYVNAGGGATKTLKKTLNDSFGGNFTVDKKFSTQIINAVNNTDIVRLFNTFQDKRIGYYESLVETNTDLSGFLEGWKNRVNSFPSKTYNQYEEIPDFYLFTDH